METGSYFECRRDKVKIYKKLLNKAGGSIYPSTDYFIKKINILRKYLSEFVVETEIYEIDGRIQIIQPIINGVCLYKFLKTHKDKPSRFDNFVEQLKRMYLDTKTLPDLLNNGNILVTAKKEIKIVDVWPLFFIDRVNNGDINLESYKENIIRFKQLGDLISGGKK